MKSEVMSAPGSIAGLYLDDEYFLHYPSGMRMTDGLPSEVLAVVDPHWSQFPPANPLIAHIFGVLFFFLFFLSFVGNLLVIYIFVKVKRLRSPTNMFTVNLAVADLIMMSTMGPPVTINVYMQRYWAWGATACKIYGFTGAVVGTVSILSMVVIGYDRYNVIVRGVTGKKMTVMKALCILLAIWGYCIAVALPPLIDYWGGYTTEGLLYTCSYDYLKSDLNHQSYVLFGFTFNYMVPLILIFFFYSSIVKAVWAHELALKIQARRMNVDSLRTNVRDSRKECTEIKIAKVALTNVLIWVCAWTPYALVVLMAVLGDKKSVTPLLSQLPSFMAKTASCFNPIVYAFSHPKYREALMSEVPCLGVEEENFDDDNFTTTMKESVKNEKA